MFKTKKKKSVSKKPDEATKTDSINKKMRECREKDKDYNPLTNRCVKKCNENQKRIIKDNQYKCVSNKN